MELQIRRSEYEIENGAKLVARIWVCHYQEVMGEAACHFKQVQPDVARLLGLPESSCLLAIHKH